VTPKRLGQFIVADPKVCHGKPTFAGTRILVKEVLAQVAQGMDWAEIVQEWDGKVSREAIGEAVRLAGQAFLDHADDYAQEAASA
jgi:uncharacterized protein (DUF433 family)